MTPTPATTHHATFPVDQEIRFWMSAPPVVINLAAPLSEALELMNQHSVRRLPVVVDTGELTGMITQGDIRGADIFNAAGVDMLSIAETLCSVKVYQVMSENPLTVTPATNIRDAAMIMMENKIGGLPVVDESRMVVGIITESDLFEALVEQLDRRTAGA